MKPGNRQYVRCQFLADEDASTLLPEGLFFGGEYDKTHFYIGIGNRGTS